MQHPSFAFFITVFITLIYHDEIRWKVRNFIDKNFYRRIFVVNQSLIDYNAKLNTITDFQTVINEFISFLKRTFPDQAWLFYYRWGLHYELFEKNKAHEKIPKLIDIPKSIWQDKHFQSDIDFFILSKVIGKVSQLKTSLRGISQKDNFFYFFPLKSYKGINGFLILDKTFNYYLQYLSIKQYIIRILRKTADFLENSTLYSEVERKSLQNFLLLEIGRKISSSLNLNEVLETIIDSINLLVSYDAAGIFLIDKRKNILRRMVTRGYDKKMLDKISLKLDLGIYGWVIRNKKPSLVNDVKKEKNYIQVRRSTNSQLAVPLLNNEKILGVLALESDIINHFTPSDKDLLNTFASHAVLAIENAQLYEEALQKRRLESELVVASMVQKALLPNKPPEMLGVDISFYNIPSRIVGGDFLDIFRLKENKLGISIGDVSGKGAPASIMMAMLYAGFRSLLQEIYPVVEVVARLNNLLAETTTEGYFVTFFFGIYDIVTRKLTYTNAGHNPPIILNKEGEVRRLKVGGPILGFIKDQEYRQDSVQLEKGEYLIIFTDGVTEIKNNRGEEFGDNRLIQFFEKRYGEKPNMLRNSLFKEIKKFSAIEELDDDVTFGIVYVE